MGEGSAVQQSTARRSSSSSLHMVPRPALRSHVQPTPAGSLRLCSASEGLHTCRATAFRVGVWDDARGEVATGDGAVVLGAPSDRRRGDGPQASDSAALPRGRRSPVASAGGPSRSHSSAGPAPPTRAAPPRARPPCRASGSLGAATAAGGTPPSGRRRKQLKEVANTAPKCLPVASVDLS